MHSAAFFLNLATRYRSDASNEPSVRRNLQKVIAVLQEDIHKQIQAVDEVIFKLYSSFFKKIMLCITNVLIRMFCFLLD